MFVISWIEIIGYVGMALILCSWLFKNVNVIRLVNITGSIFSLTYGILTRTWPTAILNIALLIINSIYLFIFLHKTRKNKDI